MFNTDLYMNDTEMKKRMSLYLTPSLKKQLEQLAKVNNRTMSNMVEVLIIEAIEKAKTNNQI
ncbi:transcriptional regulator (plasmid) [Stanieria cyanosphaera PCC 7437]|uniref:Transcriptional regulator n=1 Tax=Stanieria cyanosphaera (strain ATCC 29371 / PCC 7437) TaxID=111780 RepID=K9Y235_STAC7|nr:transcriptional regulator [Stanieria cyanosphaera PCC 7437]